jgi:hypothetical protein
MRQKILGFARVRHSDTAISGYETKTAPALHNNFPAHNTIISSKVADLTTIRTWKFRLPWQLYFRSLIILSLAIIKILQA